jgi:hypothetical protein
VPLLEAPDELLLDELEPVMLPLPVYTTYPLAEPADTLFIPSIATASDTSPTVAVSAATPTLLTVRQEAMMMVTAVVQIMVVLTEAILQMIHLIIQMGLITIIQAIPLTIQALIHRIPIALTQEAAVHQLETVTE